MINGYESELGSRDYRPEYPPQHTRQHNVFWPAPQALSAVIAQLQARDARHRALFVAAASAGGGYFLDLMQVIDEIPIPPNPWCAILNDDDDGSKGPNYFHQPSLGKLIGGARTIVVCSVGARAEIYGVACERTALMAENCLLIETQPIVERQWMAFVATNSRDARFTLVKESQTAKDLLAKNMLKNKAWRQS